MRIIVNWVLSAVAVMIVAYVLPGVAVSGWFVALAVAVVLGLINAVLRPILIILTLPINILTLGLFTLVINALLVLLASKIVPGFSVDGFWRAIAFSLLLTLVNAVLGSKK